MRLRLFLPLIVGAALASGAARAEENVTLKFKNAKVSEVLALDQQLTKYQIVTDNQVMGPITVTSTEPVPHQKAIELIEGALFAKGFAITQNKSDTIQILGIGKGFGSADIPTISRIEELPTSERVVTFVCRLKFRDPAELLKILAMHKSLSLAGTPRLVPDEELRAIIITERTAPLRNLIKLIAELDQPKMQ